jgi:negative regulator of sigma E activity
VVRIEQSKGTLRFSSTVSEDVEVSAGAGGWTLSSHGGVVESASVSGSEPDESADLYVVEDAGIVEFLGRDAAAYRLVRDGELRALLVLDEETGALVSVTTLNADGSAYCIRRFISFDTSDPGGGTTTMLGDEETAQPKSIETSLPEEVSGFTRLDLYEDADGLVFAYYSDGFFSFAVFETPTVVALPEGVSFAIEDKSYQRSFTAGQATYVWETRDGGMALVGDLPPDLHEAILGALPSPEDPGLFRRLWRRLFG